MANGRKRIWVGVGLASVSLILGAGFVWTRWYGAMLFFDAFGYSCTPQLGSGQLFINAIGGVPGTRFDSQHEGCDFIEHRFPMWSFAIDPLPASQLGANERQWSVPWLFSMRVDPDAVYPSTWHRNPLQTGLRKIEGAVALWPPVVVAAGLSIVMLRAGLAARGRTRVGQCPSCGYDLRATPSASPCPECGTSPPQTPVGTLA